MFIKELTYTDFHGKKVTKKLMFNLTQAELMELEMDANGFEEYINAIVEAQDGHEIKELFKKILIMSYGVRTPQGGFDKSEEVKKEFIASQAFSDMFMLLATNADEAAKFVNGIVPNENELTIVN